jgi:hypothetical protein
MCHPAAPYIAVMVAQSYMSARAANEEAEIQNDRYVRNAQLQKQKYMAQMDRLAEERKQVAKAGTVEADKFSDAVFDQKKQLIEAEGSVAVRGGEGIGDADALLLGIHRQGLTNMNRIENTFSTTQENLKGSLKNINFKAIDAQQSAMMGIESVAKGRGPSMESQLVSIAAASAKGYGMWSSANAGGSESTPVKPYGKGDSTYHDVNYLG